MFRVIETSSGVPIRSWAEDLARETVVQLERIARAPYVRHFVCAMADAHVSEHVAVGSVFATRDTVVPSALGGDLGCGMLAAPVLGLDAATLDEAQRRHLLGRWQALIPVGKALQRGPGEVPPALLVGALSTRSLERSRSALVGKHLGTLGGGNHFVELGRAADGPPWLLVHSGSRGLGAAVAEHHRGAEGRPLQGLSTKAGEGEAYLGDLTWALAFARANRVHLAHTSLLGLRDLFGGALSLGPMVDVPHNFVAEETWFGEALLVHRKGAIAARRGELALVPGSMGTASYLVLGLGNEEAFGSCSHGAGRVLRRGDTRRRLAPAAFRRSMAGVVFPEDPAMIEEAPGAYRDIRKVLAAQEDLVRRKLRLEPLVVLKG